MPAKDRERHRLAVAQMSDSALDAYFVFTHSESIRLGEMLDRDRAILAQATPRGPVGKLRLRISRTQARWVECLARRSAAEREIEKRALFRSLTWDEPTLPELELEPCAGAQ